MASWTSRGRNTILHRRDQHRVQVFHDDRWYDGWLTAHRREPACWWGMVRYVVGVGQQYVGWLHESELRRPVDYGRPRAEPPPSLTESPVWESADRSEQHRLSVGHPTRRGNVQSAKSPQQNPQRPTIVNGSNDITAGQTAYVRDSQQWPTMQDTFRFNV